MLDLETVLAERRLVPLDPQTRGLRAWLLARASWGVLLTLLSDEAPGVEYAR